MVLQGYIQESESDAAEIWGLGISGLFGGLRAFYGLLASGLGFGGWGLGLGFRAYMGCGFRL